MATTLTISAAERAARAQSVAEVLHSNAMEGLNVSSSFLREADAYVEGRVEVSELVARVRALYGLH